MTQKDYDEILNAIKSMYGTKSSELNRRLIKTTVSNLSDKDKVLNIIKVVHELAKQINIVDENNICIDNDTVVDIVNETKDKSKDSDTGLGLEYLSYFENESGYYK